MSSSSPRGVAQVLAGQVQREGGGFLVRRPFPAPACKHGMDPFLLLDEMGPITYGPGEAVGAPEHPHRGFETVTYLLDGEMEHRDSAGHHGRLGPGDVQWMTAGAGVVHSEMPSGSVCEHGGRVHGFQLWVNLPSRDKMVAARYQEIPASRVPEIWTEDQRARVRLIAGEAMGQRAVINTRSPVIYQHWTLHPGARIHVPMASTMNACVYVFAGSAAIGPEHQALVEGELAVLGPGDGVQVEHQGSETKPTQVLVLAGEPIREPVVWYGPFVMNTDEQIRQAIRDYQSGRMGQIKAA